MSQGFTREQKLVFCLAQNATRLQENFDYRHIFLYLIEYGILPSLDSGKSHEEDLLLFKTLFQLWTPSNGARNIQFDVFLRAVINAGNGEVLDKCLPDLRCSEEELDIAVAADCGSGAQGLNLWLFSDAATAENNYSSPKQEVKLKSLSCLGSGDCESMLQRTLSQNQDSASGAWSLLASLKDFMDEKRVRQIFGTSPSTPFDISAQDDSRTASRSSSTKGLHRNFIPRFLKSTSLSNADQTSGVAFTKARRGPFTNNANILQTILLRHKVPVGKVSRLQASAADLMKKQPKFQNEVTADMSMTQKMASRTKENSSLIEGKQSESNNYERLLLQFAFNEVNIYWKQTGIFLGLKWVELDAMDEYHQNHHLGIKDMAYSMLQKYVQWKGQTSMEFLRGVLKKVKLNANPRDEMLLPLPPPAKATGREKEMKNIRNFFWGSEAENFHVLAMEKRKIKVITGVGGVGKTTLAKTYAHKHAKAYSDGVFYFNVESYASLLLSLKKNLLVVQSVQRSKWEPNTFFTVSENSVAFYSHLRRCPRALIIMDNVDETDLVKDCLPDSSIPSHVIVTTRKKTFQNFHHEKDVGTLTLDTLGKKSAVSVLLEWAGRSPEFLSKLPEEEKEYAKKLAVDPPAEGLPLALAHAGLFIEQHEITFKRYWEELQRKKKELDAAALDMNKFLAYFRLSHLKETLQRAGVFSPTDFLSNRLSEVNATGLDQKLLIKAAESLRDRGHVYLTWEMDLDGIQRKHPRSYSILEFCSVFSSQDIPKEIVGDSAFPDEEGNDRDLSMAMGVRSLKEHSLLLQTERNDSSIVYSMHHLIQASVLHRLWGNAERYGNLLQTVGQCLVKRLQLFHGNYFNPAVIALLPHAYSVAKKMLELNMICLRQCDIIDFACLLSIQYMHLDVAKELCTLRARNFERAADRFKDNLFKEQRRRCYVDLAVTCLLLNEFSGVDDNVYLAFEGRFPDKVDGSEIVPYLKEICFLAICYGYQGYTSKAESVVSKITTICSHNPPPHLDLFSAFVYLSNIYGVLKKNEKKLELLDFALTRYSHEKVEDSSLANCYHSYACALRRLKRPQEALVYSTKALTMSEKAFPKKDLRLAIAFRELGSCLRDLGHLSQGSKMTKEALTIARSALPNGSVQLADFLIDHVQNLKSVAKIEELIALLQEAISLLRMAPPGIKAVQTKTASCLGQLGVLFSQKGNKQRAIKFLTENFELLEMLHQAGELGADRVCRAAVFLGRLHLEVDDLDHALKNYKRAFELSKQLPFDLSTVKTAVSGYITCLIASQKFSVAEESIKEVSDLYCARLSNEHILLQILNRLRQEVMIRRLESSEDW